MMDVPQDCVVIFHLTDSADEPTSLITEVELSFLKARGGGWGVVGLKIKKKWKTTIKKPYLYSHS